MPEKKKHTCHECGKEARFFLTLVIGGKMKTVAYCRAHAEEAGILDPRAYNLIIPKKSRRSGQDKLELRCPKCGMNQRVFEKSGRFGCPTCYETFNSLLLPILGKMHAGEKHVGKIPKNALAGTLLKERILELEIKMNDAVKEERYEDAAVFRDDIANLKALVES